jgi:hypothetical protein
LWLDRRSRRERKSAHVAERDDYLKVARGIVLDYAGMRILWRRSVAAWSTAGSPIAETLNATQDTLSALLGEAGVQARACTGPGRVSQVPAEIPA